MKFESSIFAGAHPPGSMMKLQIHLTNPESPRDISALNSLLRKVEIAKIQTLVVFGKTDGTATLEDETRKAAQESASAVIERTGGNFLRERSWYIFSTGCEGIATPVCVAIAATSVSGSHSSSEVGLVVGAARSAFLPDEKRCTRDHVLVAADCIKQAMANGSISAEDVSLVLIKSPVRLYPGGPGGLYARSTGASRGAAALGSALALGEMAVDSLPNDPLHSCADFASRTMAFSGTEVDCVEAIVFGIRKGGDPDWIVTQTILQDLLDIEGALKIRKPEGFDPLVVLFKAGIATNGKLRGRRTTIFSGDLPPDKHLRAAASGFIGAAFGHVDSFISGGAEHQGPEGSCLCTILWKRATG